VPAEGRMSIGTWWCGPGTDARWVRTTELRPGNLKVVHHAHLMVDTTDSSRHMAAMDSAASSSDARFRLRHNPGGFFIGWTPGLGEPRPRRPGVAVALAPT